MGGPVSTMFLRLFLSVHRPFVYVDSFLHLPESYMTRAQCKELAQRHKDDEKFRVLLDLFRTPQTTPDKWALVTKTMTGTARHVRVDATTGDCLPHVFRWDEVYQIPALHMVTPMLANIDQH